VECAVCSRFFWREFCEVAVAFRPRLTGIGNGFWRSGDLTPQRGLVYDALPITKFTVCSAKEGCDVAGDALKVEDATWDADVIKASELVMVDFWAVWCGPCQMVAPIIEELAKEYAGKIKVRKLNTDENPEVAGRYQVMSIPTILFFKKGQVVEKLVGARPKRQFKEMIDSLLAQPAGSA
jgi:thioredoxin 1